MKIKQRIKHSTGDTIISPVTKNQITRFQTHFHDKFWDFYSYGLVDIFFLNETKIPKSKLNAKHFLKNSYQSLVPNNYWQATRIKKQLKIDINRNKHVLEFDHAIFVTGKSSPPKRPVSKYKLKD